MADLAEDIQYARSNGKSDQEIMDGLKSYKPEWAGDIDAAVKAGKSPTQIVDKVTTYKEPSHSVDTSHPVLDAVGRVVSKMTGGIGDTAEVAGYPNVASTLHAISTGTTPSGPAPQQFDWHHPIDTAGAGARQIAEGLVDQSPAIAGGAMGASIGSAVPVVGTAAGGLLGAAAGWALNHFGTDAKEVAQNQGHAEPTQGDLARAALNTGVNAALTRVGIPGVMGSVAKAGEGTAANLVKQAAESGAKMGGMAAGQTAANNVILNGQLPNADDVINSAVLGGATGAGLRASRVLRDTNAAKSGGDNTDAVNARLADKYAAANELNNSKDDNAARERVGRDLAADTSTALKDVQPQLKNLREADPNDDTHAALARVKKHIDAGDKPSSDDMQTLRDKLGNYPEGDNLVKLLDEQMAHNDVSKQGMATKSGEFINGLRGTPFVQNWATLSGTGGRYLESHALFHAAIGGLEHLGRAALIPLIQGGTNVLSRVIDPITGAGRPLKQFVDRFSGTGEPTPGNLGAAAAQPMSFRETQQQAKVAQAAQKAADAAAKAKVKSDAAEQRAQAKALVEKPPPSPVESPPVEVEAPQAGPMSAEVVSRIHAAKLRAHLEALNAKPGESAGVASESAIPNATPKAPKAGNAKSSAGSHSSKGSHQKATTTTTAKNHLTGKTITRESAVRLSKEQTERGMQDNINTRNHHISEAMRLTTTKGHHEALVGLSDKMDHVNSQHHADTAIKETMAKMHDLPPTVRKAIEAHLQGTKTTWRKKG